MRPSLRFLGLAVIGWAGFRAWSLGGFPNPDLFKVTPSEAKTPPIVATQFPDIEPIAPAQAVPPALPTGFQAQMPSPAPVSVAPVRYVQALVGVPVSMARGVGAVYRLPPAEPALPEVPPSRARYSNAAPRPEPALYSELPPIGQWPIAELARLSRPAAQSTVPAQSPPFDPRRIDRLQLSSWAMLRSQQTGVAGSRSLASGGQLGASQAGARLIYNLDRRFAVVARMSSEVGRRGGEVAAGVRIRPLVSVPIGFSAERRQAIGRYGGGRDAFAFFAEGGLYERPLPWQFALDAYFQGGVVGLRSRDLFIDGAATVTRPLFHGISAGFGVWGGAQPGLYRVDAGPRVTIRLPHNLKAHLDYRQQLAGNARPGSGPVLTLAGDF